MMALFKAATAALLILQGASVLVSADGYPAGDEVLGTNSCGVNPSTKMSYFDSFVRQGDFERQAGVLIVLDGIDKLNSNLCDPDTAVVKMKADGLGAAYVMYCNGQGSGCCRDKLFHAVYQSARTVEGGKQMQIWPVKKCT